LLDNFPKQGHSRSNSRTWVDKAEAKIFKGGKIKLDRLIAEPT